MYASSASVEAAVAGILDDKLPDALAAIDETAWPTMGVQVIAGRERLPEEEPPVILVAYQGSPDSWHEDGKLVGAFRVLLTVQAPAMFDRGARDIAGTLIAACRVALAADQRFYGWTDEQLSPLGAAAERSLGEATALATVKLTAGPPRGRRINPDARFTEASISVTRRP